MHSKAFDRAIRRYVLRKRRSLQQSNSATRKKFLTCATKADPATEPGLASPSRAEDSENSEPISASQRIEQPLRKLEQMEGSIRAQIEPFPSMIIDQMKKIHEDLRFFLISNGHADELGPFEISSDRQPASQRLQPPHSLRRILDEVTEQETIGERMKAEIWADNHSRNVGVLLTNPPMFLTYS